jgi:hypothetical protein
VAEDKPQALAKSDQAWQTWLAFVDRNANYLGRGTDGWTLAEAIAHVAHWQEWATTRIQHVLDGGNLGEDLPVDEMNAQWAAEDAGITYRLAVDRMKAAWSKLRLKIEQTPEERWNDGLTDIVQSNTWDHYAEHTAWHTSA